MATTVCPTPRRWVELALVAFLAAVLVPGAVAASVASPPGEPIVRTGIFHIPTVRIDVDGDGQPDDISANADGSQIRVDVFLSRTARQTSFHFASTECNVRLLACDVTNDGACDLVFSSAPSLSPIAVCVNRGDGTFEVRPCGGHIQEGSWSDLPAPDQLPAALIAPSGSSLKTGAMVRSCAMVAGPPPVKSLRGPSGPPIAGVEDGIEECPSRGPPHA